MTIELNTLDLYLMHGGELLWLDDPTRFPRPNGTTQVTDQMFIILSQAEDILAQLTSGYYSEEMTQEMLAKLLNLEQKMMPEVYGKLLSIHNLTIETLYNKH